MAKFTAAEYHGFDSFIQMALRRVEQGKLGADEAHTHILHALTAFDRGEDQETVPYMRTVTDKWIIEDG